MPYQREIEMAINILDSVNTDLPRDTQIKPTDILSAQRIEPLDPLWIIYCASPDVKARILSVGFVTVSGQQYPLKTTHTHVLGQQENIRQGKGCPYTVFPWA